MLENILVPVSHFITHTISSLGYSGVALLMAIESAAIPLPSEVIMPFAGTLVPLRFSLWGLALAGAIGSTVGSLVTYALGYYGGRPLIRKYGHWVLLTEHDLDLTEKFFLKFGAWSSFFGRLLPVVRTFISIPAGIGKEKLTRFVAGSFVGSFIWSYFLAWLGLKLGEHWKDLETYFRKFDYAIAAIVLIALIWWLARHIKNRVR